jgi:hypothetical protein
MSRRPGKIRQLFVRSGWLDRRYTLTDLYLTELYYGTDKPTPEQQVSALRAAHVEGAGRVLRTEPGLRRLVKGAPMDLKTNLRVGALAVAALLTAGLSCWSISENSQPAASGEAPSLSETSGPSPAASAPAPKPATSQQSQATTNTPTVPTAVTSQPSHAAPPTMTSAPTPASATSQPSHAAPPTMTSAPTPASATSQPSHAALPTMTSAPTPASATSQPSHNATSPPTTPAPATSQPSQAAAPSPTAIAPAPATSPPPSSRAAARRLPLITPMPAEAGMSEADWRQAQRALHRLGYCQGHVDGSFGPLTRAAIRRFQQDIGAESTGFLTAEELTRLLAENRQTR